MTASLFAPIVTLATSASPTASNTATATLGTAKPGTGTDALKVTLISDADFATGSTLALTNGSLVYTPGLITTAKAGSDTLKYTVTDTVTGAMATETQTVTLGSPANRNTQFRILQFKENTIQAGSVIFGPSFASTVQQVGKVGGDIFEIIEAAALWNAMAAWNGFMDTGVWSSNVFSPPPDAIATPTRKVAIIKLPRGYDATRLFTEKTRRDYLSFQNSLERSHMELKMSSPDIVGVRIPDPMPPGFAPFLSPLPNLQDSNRQILEGVVEGILGTLEARNFLFAIAVKTSTRSDRLYQPLFEANVLKFLIGFVLHGGGFRFHVHMGSFEGAAVERRYRAASMTSILIGGAPTRAIDDTYEAIRPRDTAQRILNELPIFPL